MKPAATPYVGMPDESAIATLAETSAAVDQPNVAFVDARTAEEYAAGHIPGAVDIPFTDNAAPDSPHIWKSADELRAMYAAAGITPDKNVIAYCSTGVRSAATYFTLVLIGYRMFRSSPAPGPSGASIPNCRSRKGRLRSRSRIGEVWGFAVGAHGMRPLGRPTRLIDANMLTTERAHAMRPYGRALSSIWIG